MRELADHLAAAPEHFLQQARGEEVDWSAGTGVEPAKLASHFRQPRNICISCTKAISSR